VRHSKVRPSPRLGHLQTSPAQDGMSASPLKADIGARGRQAAMGHRETFELYSITSSARVISVGWNGGAKRLGGLEVDGEVELDRLLNRKVARLRSPQDLGDTGLTACPFRLPGRAS
jgi:hypothetical protein